MKNRAWLRTVSLTSVLAGVLVGCSDEDVGILATGTPDGGTPSPDAPVMEANTPDGGTFETWGTVKAVWQDITGDTTWNDPVYLLTARIHVMAPARLTIAPGTRVLGLGAPEVKAALIVERGAQLIANGTREAPIVFTSGRPEGQKRSGDWGGVVLLGSARINTGRPCAGGVDGCLETYLQGLPPTSPKGKFGGVDDASSCGELSYVRVEFPGGEIDLGSELNGLTFGGCGWGTKVSHVQVHRGFDDGIEVFGGTVNMDHVVLTGSGDDSLDWDYGWRGKVQFLVIHQRAGIGHNGIEAASSAANETALPRSNPVLYNVTMIGRPAGGIAITFKEGTQGRIYNAIIQGFRGDVIDFRSNTVDLTTEWPTNLTVENTLFWDNTHYIDESVPHANGGAQDDDMGFPDQMSVQDPARRNKLDVDPGIMAGDLSTTAIPDYVPANAAGVAGQATPVGVPDVTATYAGAFAPGVPAWTEGWTAYPIPAP